MLYGKNYFNQLKRLIFMMFANISPLQGLFLDLPIFLQIFARRCRLKKLQSSKIFVARKLRVLD
jgi:hypothetical protein